MVCVTGTLPEGAQSTLVGYQNIELFSFKEHPIAQGLREFLNAFESGSSIIHCGGTINTT